MDMFVEVQEEMKGEWALPEQYNTLMTQLGQDSISECV
jgi:hypothetical protein